MVVSLGAGGFGVLPKLHDHSAPDASRMLMLGCATSCGDAKTRTTRANDSSAATGKSMRVSILLTTVSAFNPFNYWKLEEIKTRLLGTISRGSSVLDIDCVDGAKHLYYLPFGCSVTQWLNEEEAAKDRGPVAAAAQKLGLTVTDVKARAYGFPKLQGGAFDACVSMGAVGRAKQRGGDEAATQLIDVALEALKPDGRLYMVEPDPALVTPILASALDENPYVKECEASEEHGAIICVVTRVPLATVLRGMDESASYSNIKPKKA